MQMQRTFSFDRSQSAGPFGQHKLDLMSTPGRFLRITTENDAMVMMDSEKAGEVGEVESVGDKWAFALTAAGKRISLFSYKTKEEARTARTALQIAVDLANAITPSVQQRSASTVTRAKRKALRAERRATVKAKKSRKKRKTAAVEK